MATTTAQLEERVATLEDEVARLKLRSTINSRSPNEKRWHRLLGKYADNPDFEEAMRLGREYRLSQNNTSDSFLIEKTR